jgi:signal transduction histidine kinase
MSREITAMINAEKKLAATGERKALLAAMADVRGSLGLGLANIRAFLLTRDDGFRQKFGDNWATNTTRVAYLQQRQDLLTASQAAAFKRFSAAREIFAPLPPQMFAIRASDEWNLANAWLATRAVPVAAAIGATLDAMIENQQGLMDADAELARAAVSNLKTLLWILLAVGMTGAVVGALDIASDIADRKRQEEEKATLTEQLRQSQKMEAIGQLAGGIAHDFGNLLTVITGYCQLLLRTLDPDDRNRTSVDQIRSAGDQAGALVGKLLAFSRRQVPAPERLDMGHVIIEIEKMLGPVIDADPSQMQQVLMNLVVNGRDAMPLGGQLSISVANTELASSVSAFEAEVPAGKYVVLAVSDSGTGIDEETMKHMFEPLFTTKKPGQGTGLGLATLYSIVEQSGGHIAVDSLPGAGTTFRIYLPHADAKKECNKPRSEDLIRDFFRISEAASETVLVVEDDGQVR